MRYFIRKKPDLHQESDVALLSRYKKNGDPECIGLLYERYAQLIYAVCLKYLKDEEESKDAVSKIFEKLFIDLKKYEIGLFKQWLHQVAKFHCLTILEKKKKNRILPLEEASLSNLNLPEEDLTPYNFTIEQLAEAINDLEEQQKTCIRLFYLKKKQYASIAEITGYSLMQVKSYIQNGKRNLRIYLTRHHGK